MPTVSGELERDEAIKGQVVKVPSVTLVSDGLLSKHGFSDGDAPDHWLDYCDDHGIPYQPWHPILCELVKRYLLPVLDQEVEVIQIGTSHNPIRAEQVDGVDVSNGWYGEPVVHLTPEYVQVSLLKVAEVAAAIAEREAGGPCS